MNDAQAVGFGQSLADLLGNGRLLSQSLVGHLPDKTLQILACHIFHGDEVGPFIITQVKHPADIPVGDHPGRFQFIAEPLDRPFISRVQV